MNNLDPEEEEQTFRNECLDELNERRDELIEKYKNEDLFTGSLEDYGLSWRDFL